MADAEITLEDIKAFAWHLKVQGAYVQQPVPAIYGLEHDIVIGSNDANALYPISIMHQNIGYDTLHSRVYDAGTVKPLLGLLTKVFKAKTSNPAVVQSAISGFTNALQMSTKDYFTRKSVQKKKEVLTFTIKYYGKLISRIFEYDGNLEDILTPIDDRTYFLLKSCLYPIIETVVWLSPQNRGYSQTVVDYVFFNDDFMKNQHDIFVFTNINSTRTSFKVLSFEKGVELFKSKILNPYGVLFDKHSDNLAFDVSLIKSGLIDRKAIKDRALVIGALLSQWDLFTDKYLDYFLNPENDKYLSDEQADDILNLIQDGEDRDGRIDSLTTFELEIPDIENIPVFLALREAQFNAMQLGIKVTLNSLYGIYGLITWLYASPIIGNAITTAGKIYGIKLFQEVTTKLIGQLNDDINNGEYNGTTTYKRRGIN